MHVPRLCTRLNLQAMEGVKEAMPGTAEHRATHPTAGTGMAGATGGHGKTGTAGTTTTTGEGLGQKATRKTGEVRALGCPAEHVEQRSQAAAAPCTSPLSSRCLLRLVHPLPDPREQHPPFWLPCRPGRA